MTKYVIYNRRSGFHIGSGTWAPFLDLATKHRTLRAAQDMIKYLDRLIRAGQGTILTLEEATLVETLEDM